MIVVVELIFASVFGGDTLCCADLNKKKMFKICKHISFDWTNDFKILEMVAVLIF